MADDISAPSNITMQTADVEQPALAPAAQPTSLRFSPPAAAENTSLMDLARGLSTLDSGLGAFLDQRQQQQDQVDKVQAEADFHKNNAAGYAEAVQKGLIPAFASKAYIDSYKRAQGELAGNDLEQKLSAAYDAWPGKTSTDPSAYANFAKSFFAANIGTNDPQVLAGLMPVVNRAIEQGYAKHIQDAHTATVQGYSQTQSARTDQAIDAGRDAANAAGKPLDLDTVANKIGAIYQQRMAVGDNPQQAQRDTIDAITTQALLARGNHGPEILSLLDRNIPGTNGTWAQTEYGGAKKVETRNALEALGRRALADQAKAQKDADDAALGDVQTRTLTSIAANPGQPIPDSLIAEGTKYDPEFRIHALIWQDTINKNAGTSDPTAIMQMNSDIMNGRDGGRPGDPSVIRDAMLNGVIKSSKDLNDALRLQAEVTKAGGAYDTVTKSTTFTAILDTIKQRTASSNDLSKAFDPKGLTNIGLGLQYDFRRMSLEWASAHPNASPLERESAIAAIGKTVLDRIGGGEGDAVTVTQPAGAAPNPYLPAGTTVPNAPVPAAPAPVPATPPLKTGAAHPVSGGTAARPQGISTASDAAIRAANPNLAPDPLAVAKWVAGLPPDQEAQLRAEAARTGVDPMALAARVYAKQPPAPAATPPAAAVTPAATPAPAVPTLSDGAKQVADAIQNWRETDPASGAVIHQLTAAFQAAFHNSGQTMGNYTLAAIKDNPKAAHILDFVSGPESRGNYNAYFGHGGSTTDLSKMTLDQILAWQHDRVAAGSPSSATGRYQFMQKTLAALKVQMGLKGTEKFTPELQDRLAIQLLKNRGYDRWVAGKMDDATFANNLAEEWASLPNVHTGRSVYDGDGLNRSLVTPKQTLGALKDARALPGPVAEADEE